MTAVRQGGSIVPRHAWLPMVAVMTMAGAIALGPRGAVSSLMPDDPLEALRVTLVERPGIERPSIEKPSIEKPSEP